jgi:putative MATE family efflux protein
MKDLTKQSIASHIVGMALPIMAGMLLQTLYYVVDLYFVSRLGDAAIAGVSGAGNLMFLIFALTQTLGVGIVALIAQAVGRTEQSEANLVFNQSLALAASCAVLTVVAGYAGAGAYMRAMSADSATAAAGTSYLYWFIPGLALQFALVSMGSALRGTGIVKPTMAVQGLTVLLNVVLAPVLIAGWGTGHALGVAGAGLASSISIAAGVVMLGFYFVRLEKYVALHPTMWAPRFDVWGRLLKIGLPAGGEFALMFVYFALIFWIIRRFGADAQAGFGVGSRVMQSIMLPAMAVAFAVAPVVGQNFGARQYQRVREAFRSGLSLSCVVMFALTLICQLDPQWFIRLFSSEPPVVEAGALFLQIIAWNFIGTGIVFTCSSTFQGLGNTLPSLLSSASRLVTFAIPALWLARQPWFTARHLWYLSVASLALQAVFSLLLLRREFRDRLPTGPVTEPADHAMRVEPAPLDSRTHPRAGTSPNVAGTATETEGRGRQSYP